MAVGATLRLTYNTNSGDDVVVNFKYVDTSNPSIGVGVMAFSDGLIARKALFISPFSEITALTKAEIYQTVIQDIPLS